MKNQSSASLPPSSSASSIKTEDRGSLRILLVEDNAVDLLLGKNLLARMGHQVQSACDGSEALRLITQNTYDLILMDIVLPQLSGLDVAKEIRKIPEKFRIPIIAVTSDDAPGSRKKYSAAGLNGYVAKPMSEQIMRSAIQRATGERHEVLIVEDNEADYEMARIELSQDTGSYMRSTYTSWCQSISGAFEILENRDIDIVLLDYSLPDTIGLSGLARLRENYPNLPVILYTGNDEEEVAIAALKAGAQDYVIKGQRGGNLIKIVRYALERNEIEIDLKLAQSLALAASHAKSDFLANMSHEIRTPLTAILGFNEIALEESESPAQQNALKAVKRNCEHLIQVINNVLDLSKIENSSLEPRLTAFNPSSILDEIGFAFKLRARDKGISCEYELCFPLPNKIVSDPLYLKQILFNLIGNAIKFTSVGGVKVVVSNNAELNQIVFKVIDTGIGISPEGATKLFVPFSQGDSSATRKYGGTGLGLVISRRLAISLGGSVTFESVLGAGSTFILSIDAGPDAQSNLVDRFPDLTIVEASSRSLDLKFNGKVLIVDDMPDNRSLMGYYLKQIGAMIALAEDGAMAIEMVGKEDFDLILLDMQMPILDGYQCAKKLREMDIKIPIIAITASAMSGAEDQCLRAGCSGYLRKPFTREEIIATLNQYLPESGRGFCKSVPEPSYGHFTPPTDPGLLPIALNFARGVPARIKNIVNSYDTHNIGDLQIHSHQLASAKMFGFGELGEVAYEISRRIKEDEPPDVDGLVARLKVLAENVVESEIEIEALIQKHTLQARV